MRTFARIMVQTTLIAFLWLIVCSHAGAVTGQEDGQVSREAIAVRRMVKRYGNSSEISTDMDTRAYMLGAASAAGYGGSLLALCILTGLISVVVQCAKCCCVGKKYKEREDYWVVGQKRMIVQVISGIFLLLVCIFCFIALASNSKISTAVAGKNEGLLNIVQKVKDDLFILVDDIAQGFTELVDSIPVRVLAIRGILGTLPAVLQRGPSDLSAELASLSTDLTALSTFQENFTVGNETYTYRFTCVECQNLANSVNSARNALDTSVQASFNDVNGSYSSILDNLIASSADITSDIRNTLTTTIADAKRQATPFQDNLTMARGYVNQYDPVRSAIVVVFVLLPIIGTLFYGLGLFFRKVVLLNLSVCNLYFGWLLLSFLLCIHLPLALIIGDLCVFLTHVEKSIPEPFDNVYEYCQNDKSLIDALNISQAVSFKNQLPTINFDTQAIDQAFSPSSFQSMRTQVSSMTLASLGIDPAQTDALIVQFNSSYTRANISNAGPMDGDVQTLLEIRGRLVVENRTSQVITRSQSTVNNVGNILNNMKVEVIALANRLITAANEQINDLVADVQNILGKTKCGFIYKAWKNFKKSLCVILLSALSNISLYFFLTCLFAIPVYVMLLLWKNRWFPAEELPSNFSGVAPPPGGGKSTKGKKATAGEDDDADTAQV